MTLAVGGTHSLTYAGGRLFIDAFWSSAGKGLTFWLSFVMSNCEVVTFPFGSDVVFDFIDS